MITGAARMAVIIAVACCATACDDEEGPSPPEEPEVPQDIFAPLGEPLPSATDGQLEQFERGLKLVTHRFSPEEGLGPRFNVDSCASCHLDPVIGGVAARYRNFSLVGQRLDDGTFLMGPRDGIVHTYGIEEFAPVRPPIAEEVNIVAQRNPIPLFGTGLIAEIPEESILANADPDDESGDGISGRPNYDGAFVGRFGRKAQTVDIEGFVRGPIFNHMGITTDPLPPHKLAALPVPSDGDTPPGASPDLAQLHQGQASPPSEPLEDDDDVPDPEMSSQDLFDIVAFTMLLAAPKPAEPTEASKRGEELFDEIGCTDCHVPTLESPRGAIPLYSNLLLHDMGEELADGIEMGLASGSEFRTQPLWGVAAAGPWLHDGRADTLDEAIRWHGGEGQRARDEYTGLSDEERDDIIAFLESLGGAELAGDGLVVDDEPIPGPGERGGPREDLNAEQLERWHRGRERFDQDALLSDGLGDPHFNGDSCRSCHAESFRTPDEGRILGTHGPLDVSVVRGGAWTDNDEFVDSDRGTILPRVSIPDEVRFEAPGVFNTFELRASPPLLGLGLIEEIDEEALRANADPDDERGDGIRGRVSELEDGRVGRFGWKAEVPDLREFTRDAFSNELGHTVPDEAGHHFGNTAADGQTAQVDSQDIDLITDFVRGLAPPAPPQGHTDGEEIFETIGCASCHIPELSGAHGPVHLYSDLLLHDIAPDDYRGIPTDNASGREFRTPPLWGLSDSAPYMHDGRATTIEDAIDRHHHTAAPARQAFESLSDEEKEALLAFLYSL